MPWSFWVSSDTAHFPSVADSVKTSPLHNLTPIGTQPCEPH